ncbi:MBL fold metallo-hydrolase [Myxococcus sp. AS-1-15]|uniref:MBL fold metallo-hydrolase n=1 Tax=Myxococcus sp. AS-1-15 TaxID=2874600 RepID=UPI001CBB1408|nr:MBL fold metallo-hydrolase [Myxococcus sp. AS-1-15]MBZ4397843.1 MBL fold metallo-hydrolase [Myxococcus sp. AS-1-15]BDT31429.1 MBL fold metallo-hydrolase [Myxococcus sp. MH1]
MTTRFKNLDGSGPQPFGTVFKWAVADKLAGRRRKSPDHAPVPRVEPDLTLLHTPPAPGEGARLTWLGHASWLVQLDGLSLLIDPVLRDAINVVIRRNVPPGVPIDQLPPIATSLVSHNHYDHLDLPTLLDVGAPIVTGLGHAPVFKGTRLGVTELNWWQSTKVGPVTVHFVPAQHWSRRGLNDANQMLWGGFVVEGSTARVYHSGDTAWFDGFADIGKRFPGLDAALLPIGAYDPEWFMSRQHMNPEDAARAYDALGAKRFLAMHWGTFKLTDEPLDEPPRRLDTEWNRRGWPREDLHVLPVGGTLTVRAG